MPTQENLGESHSENEERAERPSATSGSEVLAAEKPSLTDTPEPMQSEMTKAEALAIVWTGLEVLARQKQAVLFQSRLNGCVVVNLLATEFTYEDGLKALASDAANAGGKEK